MNCECGQIGAHTCNGLGENGYRFIDPNIPSVPDDDTPLSVLVDIPESR